MVSHVFRAACSGSPQITVHIHVHVHVQAGILFQLLLCAEVLILYTENAQNSCLCIMWFDLMANMITVFPRNLTVVRFYFKAPFGAARF